MDLSFLALWVCLLLSGLNASNTEQNACVVTNDACSVGCPCAIFTVNQVMTSKLANGTFVTNVNMAVTNLCPGNVYYVEYV